MKLLRPKTAFALALCACHLAGSASEIPAETFDDRAKLATAGALTDESRLTGGSPMHFWTAQRLFEVGEKKKALAILSSGMKLARTAIEKRESAKSGLIGYNGFIYWAALNCYVRWHHEFPPELLEDYRYVFTHARNYKGTTSNLSMIHTLALLLADGIWGAENLPKDGQYGARGAAAITWLNARVEHVAKRGSGEFASRPYMIFNVGTLLTLDNEFIPPDLRKKAAMAYEMSVAHAAGTWLHGHWAVPSGRSYPDQLTQRPNGSAAMLWTYFGGVQPKLDAGSTALFSAGEKFRPHPIILKAATDRSEPYVCRSRWDGDKLFQTTFMNRTYAVFSTATLPGASVWGQTYPYGVMWDEADAEKGSHLWVTVPIDDEKRLGYHTHGINGRAVQFAQNRGSFVMVAPHLDDPKHKYPYLLGSIPGGWKAMINDSVADGRIYLHYGSVIIGLSASQPFQWDPSSGTRSGLARADDSEFRIKAPILALGLETSLPTTYGNSTPAEQLAAFKTAVQRTSRLLLKGETASFTDHDGNIVARTFDGDTLIDGRRESYEQWPLLENPWMRQEWDGNLTISDGKTIRTYDVKNWTITDKAR